MLAQRNLIRSPTHGRARHDRLPSHADCRRRHASDPRSLAGRLRVRPALPAVSRPAREPRPARPLGRLSSARVAHGRPEETARRIHPPDAGARARRSLVRRLREPVPDLRPLSGGRTRARRAVPRPRCAARHRRAFEGLRRAAGAGGDVSLGRLHADRLLRRPHALRLPGGCRFPARRKLLERRGAAAGRRHRGGRDRLARPVRASAAHPAALRPAAAAARRLGHRASPRRSLPR